MNTPSDEQLVREYRSGHSDRFELLVRRYGRELFNFVYRLLGSAASAEDVVQETFLQVHMAASTFDCGRKFRPWIFTIAANKARDLIRSQKRRPECSLGARVAHQDGDEAIYSDLFSDGSHGPALTVESEERSRRIRHLVEQLPHSLREVLILGYFHGFAYKEMAQMLDVPLGTVKSRLHTAVSTFGKLYEASEESADRPRFGITPGRA